MRAESVVTRSMVRGILVDDTGHVLLMKMRFPWFDGPVWIAPGGGLEEGETAIEGLERELREETGRSGLSIGAEVWEQRFVVEHEGHVMHAHERYFVVQTQHFVPDTGVLEEHEQAWFAGFRWWRPSELASSSERTSPENLPSLLARVAVEVAL